MKSLNKRATSVVSCVALTAGVVLFAAAPASAGGCSASSQPRKTWNSDCSWAQHVIIADGRGHYGQKVTPRMYSQITQCYRNEEWYGNRRSGIRVNWT